MKKIELMMLEILFFSICNALRDCSVELNNVKTMKNLQEIFKLGCNNISVNGITSLFEENQAFLNLSNIEDISNDPQDKLTILFNNCDFSLSYCFIYSDKWNNVEITIINSDIGNGFENIIDVLKITLVNCTINITSISNKKHNIGCNNINFINCKFIGKIIKPNNDKPLIFPMIYDEQLDNLQILNVSFIECEFNLDDNWDIISEEDYDTDEEIKQIPIKSFLFIANTNYIKVNINFIRCYPGSNEVNNNLKLIRILDFFENEESFNNINITGEDNGLNIEQLHASDYSDLLISEDWKVIVNNTGYYPTQNITFTDESITNDDFENDNNSSSNKNNSKVSKTWKIITIVLSVVLVVVIVVFVILLIFINKKKRYDRSENE